MAGTPGNTTPSQVQDQLARLLESEQFCRAERLRRFLEFVVEETLQGRADGLTEQPIAWQLYTGGEDFDASTNATVRVDAHRLRAKLIEYYAEHPDEPVLITLPKGGYVPSFELNSAASAREDAAIPAGRSASWHLPAAIGGAAAISIVVALVLLWPEPESVAPTPTGPGAGRPASLIPTPLTSYVGYEQSPAFSPDGSQVVFGWALGDEGADLHVKVLGEEGNIRLTDSPAVDGKPAWAPNGRWIAFVRSDDGRRAAYLVPPLGGAEQYLLDGVRDIDWMPDAQHVVVAAGSDSGEGDSLFHVAIDGLATRRLTHPGLTAVDRLPSVSPDGGRIAFVRCATRARHNCDIFVVAADGAVADSGSDNAVRITRIDNTFSGLDWSPDGSHLIFSTAGRLGRVNIAPDSHGEPTLLDLHGYGPRFGRRGDAIQLAYTSHVDDAAVYRVPLTLSGNGEPAGIGPPEQLLNSTRWDGLATVSRDGTTIAFISDRSGDSAVWLSDAAGGKLREITGQINALLRWAPNGGRIAGLCTDQGVDGNDVCVVDLVSRRVERVAGSPAHDSMATWSADGQELFFLSTRTGMPGIWKARPGSEALEQVADFPAILIDSALGRDELYYVPDPTLSAENWQQELWAFDPRTGRRWLLLERFWPFALAASESGLFWFDYTDAGNQPPTLWYRSDVTGEQWELGRLPLSPYGGFPEFSVDPAGHYLLMTVSETSGSDLWIIENWH